MMHAYDKEYLNDAMNNLGEAIDYAVNEYGFTMDEFMERFVVSGLSERFGTGVPKYISGMSGTELFYEVIGDEGTEAIELQIEYECSPEYWSGWILAYYQWYSGRSFKNIGQHISMQKIGELYATLHEASEDRFVDCVEGMIAKENPPTRLQTLRKAAGYSQRDMSDKSGVSLRSIQQYEQRAKDINKASVANLMALAQALGCKAEDLVEY